MSSKRPQGVWNRGGIHGRVPFVVQSRDGDVTRGDTEGRQVVPRARRRGGLLRSEGGTRRKGSGYATQQRTPRVAAKGRWWEGACVLVLLSTDVKGNGRLLGTLSVGERIITSGTCAIATPNSGSILCCFVFFPGDARSKQC